MLQFEIEKGSETILFKFPENIEEITLKQYCEFEIKNESINFEFKDLSTLSSNEVGKYVYDMCVLLSCFTDKDLNEVLSIPISFNVKIQSNIDINGLESLFAMMYSIVMSYEPTQRNSFKWKGKTFTMPTMVVNRITGKLENIRLNAGEMILTYQYNHILTANKDTDDAIKTDLMYNRIRAMIAILCRKKDEDLPIQDEKIDTFIEDRMDFFKDVPFSVGIDLAAFFFNTHKIWNPTGSQSGLLSHQTNQNQQVAI